MQSFLFPNDHSSAEVRRTMRITVLLARVIEFITGDHIYSSVPTKDAGGMTIKA